MNAVATKEFLILVAVGVTASLISAWIQKQIQDQRLRSTIMKPAM